MATTTNYSWTTPDDTALVKDGAAAIRSLGTAIDTTVFNNASAAIAKTIVDAKGDLIAATAADTVARLAVGTNNQVLTADSSTATGLKWASPSSSAPSFSLLNAGGTALTGASTITVSSISGMSSLFILIKAASSATAGSTINLRVNSNSNSIYTFHGAVSFTASPVDTSILGASNGVAQNSQAIGTMPDAADGTVSGTMLIQGCDSSGTKMFFLNAQGSVNSPYTNRGRYGGGTIEDTNTISSISLISASGNFDSGTLYVYGSAV